ncbi:hypothetical protein SAMN04488118_11227 [Epibacterium ulvae]|uniref:Uncharacterized protein n=1 Tax=Epibacterium ulvae TaxID=1156985 RepID=A0A1G5RBM2_9RHOB|nr:hypothetical protein SAMN04488118_11227 [Epibacterium ulvae]
MPKIQLESLLKRCEDFEMEEDAFTVFDGPSGCGLEPKARDLATRREDHQIKSNFKKELADVWLIRRHGV